MPAPGRSVAGRPASAIAGGDIPRATAISTAPPQEIDEWKHKCPIKRFKKRFGDGAVMTSEEVEAIDQAAKAGC